jgi:hypothetical protein
MSAVCAHVLMSFLSLSLWVYLVSYIINLFIRVVTCLRMLNHTSVMVCVTELLVIQVNVLLGKRRCKVFYVIPWFRFTCNFIELYHHSTTIVVAHGLYLQQSFLHVSVICSSSGKHTVQKWLLPKIITVYECIKTFHLYLMWKCEFIWVHIHHMTVVQFNILLCTIGSKENILPLRLKYGSTNQ